ncbi:hypothetical protein LCGC14_1777930, partial [marine sediment metagenome]
SFSFKYIYIIIDIELDKMKILKKIKILK